ncbi:MAG: hypothetical protein CM1200mP2_39400 [Planctomycetaceae bacterium]|nr:MAG: hypothetical protein CM1200mP2_39400 [Planctomycetaceae bacterium]
MIDQKRPTFRPNRVRSDDPFYSDSRRRSVFLPVVRNAMPDILSLFDAADPNGIVGPTQRHHRAVAVAVPVESSLRTRKFPAPGHADTPSPADDDTARIALAYRLAGGRSPRPAEVKRVSEFLAAEVAGETKGTPEEKRLVAWTGFAPDAVLS